MATAATMRTAKRSRAYSTMLAPRTFVNFFIVVLLGSRWVAGSGRLCDRGLVEGRGALGTGGADARSEALDGDGGDDEDCEEEQGVFDHAGAADIRELLHRRSPRFSMGSG